MTEIVQNLSVTLFFTLCHWITNAAAYYYLLFDVIQYATQFVDTVISFCL